MKPSNTNCSQSACEIATVAIAELLNQTCYYKTLDQHRLNEILHADDVSHDLLTTHPQLFSNIATFISKRDYEFITESIQAIERVIALPGYQEMALTDSHPQTKYHPQVAGVFMGYDFHLDQDRPKLIEINTNAGGAFLNVLLISAQIACCMPMQTPFLLEKKNLYRQFVDMFLNEWKLQRGKGDLARIAIVDNDPEMQFLYPEFKIAQRIFIDNGIDAVITAPEHLNYENNRLWCNGEPIDLVYNRLTDFAFVGTSTQILNNAYQAGAVVVTPNPYHHAIYANKKNLITLGDDVILKQLGVDEKHRKIIKESVPATHLVTADNAMYLWQHRKELFFKPVAGYGGKATYRGDKLTKRVWDNILQGQYIAQQQIAPSERGAVLDNQLSSLKMDVRAYAYQGNIQLLAARLYQGQTTNFRTQGGGFSPVFVL
jgi:hypothetical protein